MVSRNRDALRKCSSGAAKRHKKIYKEDILITSEGSLKKFVVAQSASCEEEGNNLCFRQNGNTTREANITLVNISALCINTESVIIP